VIVRAGLFLQYEATRSFELSDHTVIEKGDRVLFDGITVRIGPRSFEYLPLRGAVAVGWIVLVAPKVL
jgi:hypothetical protein